jgi:hypothetical protein
MFLKDRHELSVKNQWYNGKKEVYFIMTREEMEIKLNLSLPTVIKTLRELKNMNLIEEERRGQGKSNIFYLLEFKNIESQTSKTFSSRPKKSLGQGSKTFSSRPKKSLGQNLKEFYPNHTNHKNHKFSNTYSSDTDSINQPPPVDNSPPYQNQIRTEPIYPSNNIDTVSITALMEDKLDLVNLKRRYPDKSKELQELFVIIIEVLFSRKKFFRIAKEDMPANSVKYVFTSLEPAHLEYVIECLSKNTTPVKSTKAYIQTALFNSIQTINNHYSLASQNYIYDKFGFEPKT